MAAATACGAYFIRVNVLAGARVADQGILQGEAHDLLRYRRSLGSTVRILADVAVKHSAPLGSRDLGDEVEDTLLRAGADAIIVSGTATGKATNLDDVRLAKKAAGPAPVLAGSGVTEMNAIEVLSVADGLIVGTAFKEGGTATNRVEPARVRQFMRVVRR